jgi:hypothetical protein
MPADAEIRYREEVLPPRDPSHGTPHAMVRRTLDFDLPRGHARWEQTDYGHPGRFNPWEPRDIDAKLQPATGQLRLVAEAVSALVSATAG